MKAILIYVTKVSDKILSDNPTNLYDEAWNSLGTTSDEFLQNLKENLLTLAKQGKLTVEEFNKTTGAKSWLDQIGISAKETIDKINNLKEVSSADQLASMKTGISLPQTKLTGFV